MHFLASVTTATTYQNRPVQNPRAEDPVEYILQVKIQTTTAVDLLASCTINTEHDTSPCRDVASAISSRSYCYPIQQHVDSAFNILPEMQFYPCGCTPVLHVI